MNNPKLTFCTGVGSVTGANFLVETPKGFKVLVDCGLVQGEKVAVDENREPFGYDPKDIHALVITHAHLDHVGRIPKLVKEGFSGSIYSTLETRELAELVLTDAAGILAMEAREEGLDPLYSAMDVSKVFTNWNTISYHENMKVADDFHIYLKDAGHILGSSMVEATIGDKKILFSGDLGNSPAPLLKDTEEVGDVDYIVMESVYGDRNHGPKEKRIEQLEGIIKSSIERGGTLVIPAFSIDRTQVILYELNNMVRDGKIPSIPVFVDSPMAIKATAIYKRSDKYFNDIARGEIQAGDDIFSFPHLSFTVSNSESREINRVKGAKIILAGSGMSVGGRVISHEENYLPDPKSTIMLVGYQSVGSLGRIIADGAKKVRIHGKEVHIKARIENLLGFSAHRDSDHLVEFVSTATNRLKKAFVVMGELGSSMHLAQRLNSELGVDAVVPERKGTYEL